MKLSTFVINLDKDTQRLNEISSQLNSLGIPFERFPAIYGKTMTKSERLEIASQECSEHCPYSMIGCGSSHIKLWRKIRDEKIPMTMILEDDAIFSKDFNDKLLIAFKELPNDFDILYLGCIACKDPNVKKFGNFLLGIGDIISGNSEVHFSENLVIPSRMLGTHAYILSYTGACNLINTIDKLTFHIDYQLSKNSSKLKVYKIYPMIVSQPLTSEQSTQTSNRPYILNKIFDKIIIINVPLGYIVNCPLYRIGNYQLSCIQIIYLLIGIILGYMQIDIKKVILYFTIFQMIDYIASPSDNAYTFLNIGGDFTILGIGYIFGVVIRNLEKYSSINKIKYSK